MPRWAYVSGRTAIHDQRRNGEQRRSGSGGGDSNRTLRCVAGVGCPMIWMLPVPALAVTLWQWECSSGRLGYTAASPADTAGPITRYPRIPPLSAAEDATWGTEQRSPGGRQGKIHGNARRLHVDRYSMHRLGNVAATGFRGPVWAWRRWVLVTATIFGWAGLRTARTGGPEGPVRLRGGRRDLGGAGPGRYLVGSGKFATSWEAAYASVSR